MAAWIALSFSRMGIVIGAPASKPDWRHPVSAAILSLGRLERIKTPTGVVHAIRPAWAWPSSSRFPYRKPALGSNREDIPNDRFPSLAAGYRAGRPEWRRQAGGIYRRFGRGAHRDRIDRGRWSAG